MPSKMASMGRSRVTVIHMRLTARQKLKINLKKTQKNCKTDIKLHFK